MALVGVSVAGCPTTAPTDGGTDAALTDAPGGDTTPTRDAPIPRDGGADSPMGCATASDCDDGVFCNGAEVCATGACEAATAACIGAALACDEEANACVPGFLGTAAEVFDRDLAIDAVGYDLDLRLSDATLGSESYSASVSVVLVHHGDAAISEVDLDLDMRNTVTAVSVDGAVATYAHVAGSDSRGHLTVTLPAAVAPEQAFAVVVAYGGDVNQIVGAEGEIIAGLMASRTPADERIFSTIAWPANSRWWIPTRDHPKDGAMFAGSFTFPAGYVVVSNGRVESTTPNADGTVTTRYIARTPMPAYDFHVAAFDHWTTLTSAVGTAGTATELLAYSTDGSPERVIGMMPDSHDYLVDTFGAFRWDRLTMVELPNAFGGMEHATVISISEATFDGTLDGTPAGPRADSLLTATHEDAHHWSGNMVRIESWNDFWLSESFADYLSRRYVEDASPRDGLAMWQRSLRIGLRNAEGGSIEVTPVRPSGAEVDPDTLLVTPAANLYYKKGSIVLRMLEHRIGRDVFTALVRQWFDDHAFQAVGTEDFVAHLNAVTGEDYTSFFTQWVYGTYHPELDVTYTYDAATSEVVVRVQQVQTLGPAAGFTFPLELDFTSSAGVTQRVTIEVGTRDVTARAAMPFAPVSMLVDPDVFLYAAQVCDPAAATPCRADYVCDATGGRTVRSVCVPGPLAAYPVP